MGPVSRSGKTHPNAAAHPGDVDRGRVPDKENVQGGLTPVPKRLAAGGSPLGPVRALVGLDSPRRSPLGALRSSSSPTQPAAALRPAQRWSIGTAWCGGEPMLLAEACFYALLWLVLVPTECAAWRWRDVMRAAQLRKSTLRASDLERKPIPFDHLLRGKKVTQARSDGEAALRPVVLALRQPRTLLRGSRYENDMSALEAYDGLLESELMATSAARYLDRQLYDSAAHGQRLRTPSGEPRHVAFADVWWDLLCDDQVRGQMMMLISLDPSVSSAAVAKELSSLRQRQTRAAQRKPPSPSPAARLQLVDETLRAERERGLEEQREQAQAENARLRGRMERQDAELDATTEELSRLLGVKDAEIERLQVQCSSPRPRQCAPQ